MDDQTVSAARGRRPLHKTRSHTTRKLERLHGDQRLDRGAAT